MKMNITGNGARNLNRAALNSSRSTKMRKSSATAVTGRQLNCNHNATATKRTAINSSARKPLQPSKTNRPVLNSSARRTPATDARNNKLNSGLRALKKLNSNKTAILKELEGWFTPDEAKEYVDSFEKETGATITKLATDEEVDKYDGVFWATKDGKESLWCRDNGAWVEKEELDSSKNLNSAEGEADDNELAASESTEAPASEEEATNNDEEGFDVTELLIVQEPESKELSLFIPDTPEEALPEDVEVIATVEPATAEDLDSSCGGKKKLNSSEEDGAEAATEDEAKGDTAEESTEEEEAVIELPDGETVEVEDIFVVQTDDGEYDLFIAEEDAELPEDVEVVGETVAVEEDEVLNSSRQVKKAMEKLNSSKKTDNKATK